MKAPKIMVALLAGLAAGTALGIVFAPGEGAETRDRLSLSLDRLGGSLKTMAAEQAGRLSGMVTGLKTKLGLARAEEQPDDLEHA